LNLQLVYFKDKCAPYVHQDSVRDLNNNGLRLEV